MTKSELSGKVALITGGTSGIGKATAIRFVKAGAKVIILARTMEKLEKTAFEITKMAGENSVLAIQADVSDENQVEASFKAAVDVYRQIDIVVCNAGYIYSSFIEDMSLLEWENIYKTNMVGYFLVSREAFKHWKANNIKGNLIFVSSKDALSPSMKISAYCSSKAAELHLARCLALEGGSFGIRVNSILPDAVIKDSGMFSPEKRKLAALRHGIKETEIEAFYQKRNMLKINILPEDVAEGILFFAEDRSIKTTGSILTVDGGLEAALPR